MSPAWRSDWDLMEPGDRRPPRPDMGQRGQRQPQPTPAAPRVNAVVVRSLHALTSLLKILGGPGSGNWGHAGRPGEVGGSQPTSDGVEGARMTIKAGRTVPERYKAKTGREYKGAKGTTTPKPTPAPAPAPKPKAKSVTEQERSKYAKMTTKKLAPLLVAKAQGIALSWKAAQELEGTHLAAIHAREAELEKEGVLWHAAQNDPKVQELVAEYNKGRAANNESRVRIEKEFMDAVTLPKDEQSTRELDFQDPDKAAFSAIAHGNTPKAMPVFIAGKHEAAIASLNRYVRGNDAFDSRDRALLDEQGTGAPIRVRFHPNSPSEGFYMPNEAVICVRNANIGTFTHEVGHRLEHSQGNFEAVRKFLATRVDTRGAETVKYGKKAQITVFPYKPGAKPFHSDYARRNYQTVQDTEVLSEGLERFSSNPVKFAAEDPEYFTVVLSCLRNEHRTIPPKAKKS